jgi:peptidoglycan/LPS O-acetylase OafA/YrhL
MKSGTGAVRATRSDWSEGSFRPHSDIRTVARNQVARISALDFTKGALVLIMVLYHWLNYFVGAQGFFYRYLTFLPPSFICITGFLISQVYLSEDRIRDARTPRRLIVRGVKLLGIFVALNVVIGLTLPRAGGGKGFFEILSPATLWSIYVSGNMRGGRLVAFYVLVPISYLLVLSAGLLIACRYYRHACHAATALAVFAVLILKATGRMSQNVELLSIGLMGMSIGYLPIQRINDYRKLSWVVVMAYLFYLAAITAWNVLYPLQVTGVLLTLMMFYLAGTASGEKGLIPKAFILLGKYSLFGYIAQIAILQSLRRSLRVDLTEWALVLTFFVAVSMTMISVVLVDKARARIPCVSRLYGAIFS